MDYKRVESRGKTLSMHIDESMQVVVRAPRWVPKSEVDRFVKTHENWIEKAVARQNRRNEQEALLTPERIAELRAQASAYLPQRTAYFAKLMGVCPKSVKITSAETTKTNQAYLCVGGDKQYHASTEGETSLKQKFKLKTVRPEATAL